MPKIRRWLEKRPYQPSFALKTVAASAHPVKAKAVLNDIDITSHLVPYSEFGA